MIHVNCSNNNSGNVADFHLKCGCGHDMIIFSNVDEINITIKPDTNLVDSSNIYFNNFSNVKFICSKCNSSFSFYEKKSRVVKIKDLLKTI